MSGFTASMGEQHLPYVSPSNSGSHVIGAVVLGGRDPCSRAQTTGQREEKKHSQLLDGAVKSFNHDWLSSSLLWQTQVTKSLQLHYTSLWIIAWMVLKPCCRTYADICSDKNQSYKLYCTVGWFGDIVTQTGFWNRNIRIDLKTKWFRTKGVDKTQIILYILSHISFMVD